MIKIQTLLNINTDNKDLRVKLQSCSSEEPRTGYRETIYVILTYTVVCPYANDSVSVQLSNKAIHDKCSPHVITIDQSTSPVVHIVYIYILSK